MRKRWLIGFAVALLIAAFAAPFASSSPDGLERVAGDKGFLGKSTSHISSPIPDYLFPGIANKGIATAAAGIIGTIVTFGVMYGLSKIVFIGKKGPGESA